MGAMKNRVTRAAGAPTVLLQGRVSPQTRADVQAAAEESGVSIAYYLEGLVARLIEQDGTLPLIAPPQRQREELPIEAA
ncbi:hypothetical protein [Frondihabitans sp. PAMC 28766]|uniref:hypothetical protein n=1 Tax=Frondihabitans sp. PAMC 28766 TaxID=1795630 RepID=UPI0012FFC71E|nr:hypothetical protein [Frondihabitans sp. PAMC 28766]